MKQNTDVCFLISVSNFAGLECSRMGIHDKHPNATAVPPTRGHTGQGDQALVFTPGMYVGQ